MVIKIVFIKNDSIKLSARLLNAIRNIYGLNYCIRQRCRDNKLCVFARVRRYCFGVVYVVLLHFVSQHWSMQCIVVSALGIRRRRSTCLSGSRTHLMDGCCENSSVRHLSRRRRRHCQLPFACIIHPFVFLPPRHPQHEMHMENATDAWNKVRKNNRPISYFCICKT